MSNILMLKNVTSVVEKDDTINMFKILIFLILCHFSVNIPPIGPRLMYRGRTCVSLARTHRQISFFHFFPPGKQFQGSLHCHFYQVKKSVLDWSCMMLTFPRLPIYCLPFPLLILLWEIGLQLFVGSLSKSLPMIHQSDVHNCLLHILQLFLAKFKK